MTISDISLKKYKAPLTYSLFFVLWGLTLYFLIITKFIEISTIRESSEKAEFKRLKMKKSLEILKRNKKELEKEYIEKQEEQQELMTRKKENSFANIGEFESFISDEMADNYIKLEAIARAESIKGSDKVYLPYIFSGTYEDIESFILQLENSPKRITFSDTPFKLQRKENWIFNGKLAANILNQKTIPDLTKKTELNYNKISPKKITGITVFLFNSKKYAILKFIDRTSKYISESDTIDYKGEKYKIKIINTSVFLEK